MLQHVSTAGADLNQLLGMLGKWDTAVFLPQYSFILIRSVALLQHWSTGHLRSKALGTDLTVNQ